MKKGFTAGSFDLLHAGHVMVFKECKTVCDYLIVALQSDPTLDRVYKNKPVQRLEERREVLEAIKYVDEIVEYNTEAELHKLLEELDVDIRIIGADWKGKEYTGHELPIEMHFNSRDHDYSTSSLRKRVYEEEKKKDLENKKSKSIEKK